MLVDTGAEVTIVSADRINLNKVDYHKKVSVMCIHGDTTEYPTAPVKIRLLKRREQTVRVAVAPKLPVPVLLGRDLCTSRDYNKPRGEDKSHRRHSIQRKRANLQCYQCLGWEHIMRDCPVRLKLFRNAKQQA